MVDMSIFLAAGPYTIAMNRIAYIESREGGSLLVHLVNDEVLAIMPDETDRMMLMTSDRLLMRDPIDDNKGAANEGGGGSKSLGPPEARPSARNLFLPAMVRSCENATVRHREKAIARHL